MIVHTFALKLLAGDKNRLSTVCKTKDCNESNDVIKKVIVHKKHPATIYKIKTKIWSYRFIVSNPTFAKLTKFTRL